MSETVPLVNNSITETCKRVDYEEQKNSLLKSLKMSEYAAKELEEFMSYIGNMNKKDFEKSKERFHEIISATGLFWMRYKYCMELANKMDDKEFLHNITESLGKIAKFFDKYGDELIKYIDHYHPTGNDMSLFLIGNIYCIRNFTISEELCITIGERRSTTSGVTRSFGPAKRVTGLKDGVRPKEEQSLQLAPDIPVHFPEGLVKAEKTERDYQEEEFILNIREGKIAPLAVCNLPKDYFQYNRSCHDLLKSQFPELFESIKNKGGLWYTKRYPELGLINYYHLPLNEIIEQK